MRYTFSIVYHIALSVSVGIVGGTSAAPPRKPNASQFNVLVTRSPFTIRSAATGLTSSSPLEREWMLGSIRPSGDDWSVTLINKKNRKQRVRLLPDFPADGFELLDVMQDITSPGNSRVQIRRGSQTAWITKDDKLLKILNANTKTNKTSIKAATSSKRVTPPTVRQTSGSRTRRVVLPQK